MTSFLRGAYGRALTPLARLLLRLGLTPTAVTVVGTVIVCCLAVGLLPGGHFVVGVPLVVVFLLADGLDGTMARLGGKESSLGGFLDSTLDRVADAGVFGALAVWCAGRGTGWLWVAIAALVTAQLVSYARARAEVEGWNASVGPFERTDRLVVALLAAFAVGLGAPEVVLVVALGVVAVGSTVTFAARVRAAVRAASAVGESRPPTQPFLPLTAGIRGVGVRSERR